MKKLNLIEEEQNNNPLNQLFLFENIDENTDINESFFHLKRLLLSCTELNKDNNTINLILSLFLFNANFSILNNNSKKSEKKLENLKNDLFNLIKNHDTFHYFLYNNHIDDKILLKIIPYFKYEYIVKDTYITKEGDNSTKIYFILKGKVSFRKKINSLRNANIIEKEKYTLGDYEFFGVWDIIYERKRKLSFYTLENCHLITIEKEYFKKYLEEKIVKGDVERKTFITKFLKTYMTLASYKIEGIIQNMKILYFRKGEIIYKEGDINKSIYLIFKGEAKFIKKIKNGEFHLIGKLNDNIVNLQKRAKNIDYVELIKNADINGDEDNNKNNPNYNYNLKYLKNVQKPKEKKFPLALDLLLEKQLYHDIAILGKGSMGGLEITTGILKNKYTMISNSDYTTIFKLELKYIEGHLKEFMINLLPLFLQNEKEIHSRIKQIKFIDNNIIPLNCQKFKINNNLNSKSSLNKLENNGIFLKEIQKINSKFDINEGGFIKMNDFNLSLNNKKNLLKEQLKDNQMNDNKLDCLIKEYDDKENSKLRYSGVKMSHKPKLLNINDYNSNNNINNSKYNNNTNAYNSNNNGFFSDRTKKTENEFSKINSYKQNYIYSNSNSNMDTKKDLIKNMSQRDFTKKTLRIFDKVIANYKKRKEFLKLDIFSPEILKTESTERNKRKKTLDYNKKNNNMFLKEVIILKNKKKEINSYSNTNNKTNKNKITEKKRFLSGKKNINKKINKLLMKDLNIYKSGSDNEKEDDIYIVNKNFLKRLFEKNMNKKKKYNTIYSNNFNKNYQSKKMIYYNTGRYDMPFVTQLTLKNIKTRSIKI